jgi:gliding motility-associated-like protein
MRLMNLFPDTGLNKVCIFLNSILILFLSQEGMAQCFRVINPATGDTAETKGCFPFQVTVQKCSTITAEASYFFTFPESDLQKPLSAIDLSGFSTTVLSHTYTQPGTYYIAQFVNGADLLGFQTIKVFDPNTKPTFTWKTCGTELIIQFSDTVFSKYEFNPGNGITPVPCTSKTFSYDYGIAGTYSFTVKGLLPSSCNTNPVGDVVTVYSTPLAPKPLILKGHTGDTLSYTASIGVRADEDYAFQQAAPGGSFSGLFTPGRSDLDNASLVLPITLPTCNQGSQIRAITPNRCTTGGTQVNAFPWSIFWPVCEPANEKITVRWPSVSISAPNKFELFRDGVLIASPPFANGSYLDEDNLVCGQAYKYHFRTEVITPGGTLVFLSPEIVARAISNQPPPPVTGFTASVEKRGIKVDGIPSPLASAYHLFRRDREGTAFSELGSGFQSLPYLDTTADGQSKPYCYQISFEDKCGNRSQPSAVVCPVLLKAQQVDGSIDFNWISMEGWEDGVASYELIRKATGLSQLVVYSGKNLEYFQSGQDKTAKRLSYQIKVIPILSSYPVSYSNEVSIVQESKFRFPDAFTPNQDGINDLFECYGSFVKNFQLIIYNSWGNVVFTSDQFLEGWDGKIDGLEAQTGNYSYRAIATDVEGNRLERAGFFSLIR